MGKKSKSKKKKVAPPGARMTDEDVCISLSLEIETLERELQVKSAHSEEALREEIELRAKVEQMEDDFKQEQITTFAVTADMARQYKALQEDLIRQINALETTLTEQKEELDYTNQELSELIRDKDDEIKHKDEQIRHLNERMNQMSQEFASMLTETLELMKKHIGDKLDNNSSDDTQRADFQQLLQEHNLKTYQSNTGTSRVSAGASSSAEPVALPGWCVKNLRHTFVSQIWMHVVSSMKRSW